MDPPVEAPGNPGYGTSTIRDLIPYEFGGAVDLVLAPDGVRCRLELAADWLVTTSSVLQEKAHAPFFERQYLTLRGSRQTQLWDQHHS